MDDILTVIGPRVMMQGSSSDGRFSIVMGGKDPKEPVFSIGVVQNLTGLSGRQIRYYESAGLIRPHRTKGNQRLYSSADVERLHQIKELMEQGYNIEGVRTQLDKQSPTPSSQSSQHLFERDLIGRRVTGAKLSSLFPVNNQAELSKFLQDRQKRLPK